MKGGRCEEAEGEVEITERKTGGAETQTKKRKQGGAEIQKMGRCKHANG